jgi:hypothetical protein
MSPAGDNSTALLHPARPTNMAIAALRKSNFPVTQNVGTAASKRRMVLEVAFD